MAHYTAQNGLAGRSRKRLLRRIKKLTIIVVVLVLVIVGLGVAYTWNTKPTKKVTEASQYTKTNTFPAPIQNRDPNAPVGVSLQTLSSPVVPGSNVAASLKTAPNADCTIVVEYNKIASKDTGLSPKKADEYGIVGWSWTVGADTPLGTWPGTVTCSLGKMSGVYRMDIKVVKTLD